MKRVVIIAAVLIFGFLRSAGAREWQADYIWNNGGSTTVTPGASFRLYLRTANPKPIHFRVYRIGLDEAIGLMRGRWNKAERIETPVWQGTTSVKAGRWLSEVTLGPFPMGLYDIEATSGTAKTHILGNVTTLGLLSAVGPDLDAAWAIDLRTFRRHMGPTKIEQIGNDETERQTECDPSGLALLHRLPRNGMLLVAQSADGSVDLESSYWYGAGDAHAVNFVQTDRPVYRPGQDVHFRAIARDGYSDAYRIPTGRHRVRITGPDGTIMYDREIALSRFGTLSGDANLPDAAQLGYYQVAIDGASGAQFLVQAYKKPEYLIEAKAGDSAVVGGDDAHVTVNAKYFFGRPAAGMRVRYSVGAAPYPSTWYNPYSRFTDVPPSGEEMPAQVTGEGLTDAGGSVELRIPTKRLSYEYYVPIRVEARDGSGRTVETSTSFLVLPAAIVPQIAPRQWYASVGDDVAFDVHSNDRHGDALRMQSIHVQISRETWNEKTRRYDEKDLDSREVTTDAHGAAVVHWRAPESGSYRIVARGTDERGNVGTATTYLWVLGGDEGWMPPTDQPVLIPEHATLAPNERARVLVRMPSPGRDVLIAVVSDRVESVRVVRVTGYAISLGVDAPANASQFSVQAFLPSENGVAQTNVTFTRKPQPKELRIALKADRARYEPGQRATFAIRVLRADGKPVRTELSVGVVDDAVYAVESGGAANPVSAFYGNSAWLYAQVGWYQPNYAAPKSGSEEGVPSGQGVPAPRMIAKVTSHAAGDLVKPGTTSDVYSVNAALAAVQLRANFKDTAYWTPAVVTDAQGRASVSFTWPDNLTTWRTSGLGVSEDSGIGVGQTESLVTKDFLVRLETPRFLRKGDTATIAAIVHGQPGMPDVHLRFTPQVLDPLDAALRLDANGSAETSWQLDAGSDLGTRVLSLAGTDGTRSDGLKLPLPIEAVGAAEHERDAGNVADRNSLALSLPHGYDPGALDITLTPSVAALLVQNLRVLDVYPYYCTEQTMSTALPDLFVDRVLKRTGYELPGDVSPKEAVAHAVARLRELQHDDGSWGWWEHDPGHPFMTAYALYGLAEFKAGGYPVPDRMYERGIESLLAQLETQNGDTLRLWGGAQPGSEWNTRAFMLFALAQAAPSRVDREMLARTAQRAASLNSYALSVLGLAYHRLGDDGTARKLLALLNSRAIEDGAYTYWAGDSWHYAWEDDPIETTAYALRLNAALTPGSPVISHAVAFLRAEQRGAWWYTTKDTAAAVYAIAESENATSAEFAPDETVRVLVDGRVVKSLHITRSILDAADAQVRVPASQLRDGSVVQFEREGRGALYWATDFTRYAPWQLHVAADPHRSILARLFPKQPPLKIERRYRASHSGAWRVGDEIHVDVTVTASEDVQYVAVEDPFPAGVEYAPPQGEAGSYAWSGVQFFDDRAVFFACELYRRQPLHLSYDLRVTTRGSYAAAAPTAYAMYGPPISAVGDAERVVVNP